MVMKNIELSILQTQDKWEQKWLQKQKKCFLVISNHNNVSYKNALE